MLILAHLGIGQQLARLTPGGRRWTEAQPLIFLFGTILPDVIDKGLFYIVRPLIGWESLVSTRTYGHTGIFLAALVLFRGRALAAGVATHFILDIVSDGLSGNIGAASSGTIALFYPVLGAFPALPFRNLSEHIWAHFRLKDLVFEAAGLVLLASFYRRRLRK